MMRIGRRHRPFFRINAIENRNQQKGRVLEKLGHYDPLEKDEEKQVVLDLERVKHWLDAGAVPTEAVSQILLRFGIKTKHGQEKTKRRERAKLRARAEGKFFTKAEKVAAEKAQAQEPAEDKSRAAQAAESAPPPETPAKTAEAPETVKDEEVKVENKETDTAPEETVKPEPAPTPETPAKTVEAQESAEDKSRAAQAAESAPPPETPENPDQEAQADEGDKTKAES